MSPILGSLLQSAAEMAKGLGHKVMTRGVDAMFEDLEKAATEATRRVQKARRRLKAIEKHEPFKEDEET
jgi:hypothetical protein